MHLDYHTSFKYHGLINRKIMEFIFVAIKKVESSSMDETTIIKKMNPYTLNYDTEFISYVCKLMTMIVDENYLSDTIEKYIRNHEEFYVFGTGVYAKKLIEKLEVKGIHPKGFLRTNVSEDDENFMGYNVYPISSLAVNNKSVGIVISTLPRFNDGIEEVFNA